MARSQHERIQAVAARGYWREADGRVMVDAWRRSRLSLRAFAQRYGVTVRRLVYWRTQLVGAAAEAEVQLHPVRVPPRQGRGLATDAVEAPIEICLGAACVVRVPRGVAPGG